MTVLTSDPFPKCVLKQGSRLPDDQTPAGVYLARLRGAGGGQVVKFLIVR